MTGVCLKARSSSTDVLTSSVRREETEQRKCCGCPSRVSSNAPPNRWLVLVVGMPSRIVSRRLTHLEREEDRASRSVFYSLLR